MTTLLDDGLDWTNGFDETPPRQWERLASDGKFYFDNSAGSMNSEGPIIYAGAAPLAGTLPVFWEILTPPPHGQIWIDYDLNGLGYLSHDITGQSTGHLDIDLTGATQLWIRVRSDEVSIAPYTYGSVTTITGSNTKFYGELLWDAGTEGTNPITRYELERQVDGGGYALIDNDTTPLRHFHDFDMSVDSVYDYRVRAFDSEDNPSDYSNIVTLSPLNPLAVTLVGEVLIGEGIFGSFSWNEVADTSFEVSAYEVWINVNSGGWSFDAQKVPGDTMTYQRGMTEGDTLDVKVITIDAASLSTESNVVSLEASAARFWFEFIAGQSIEDATLRGVILDSTDFTPFGDLQVNVQLGNNPAIINWCTVDGTPRITLAFTGTSDTNYQDHFENFRIYYEGEAGLDLEYIGPPNGAPDVGVNLPGVSVPNVYFQWNVTPWAGFGDGSRYLVFLDGATAPLSFVNPEFLTDTWTGFEGFKADEGKGTLLVDIGSYQSDLHTLDACYLDIAAQQLYLVVTGLNAPPGPFVQVVVPADDFTHRLLNHMAVGGGVVGNTRTWIFDVSTGFGGSFWGTPGEDITLKLYFEEQPAHP